MQNTHTHVIGFLVAIVIAQTHQSQIYKANFASPLSYETEPELCNANGTKRMRLPRSTTKWVLESQGNVGKASTLNNSLLLQNNGGHMVCWSTQVFPADFVWKFGIIPHDAKLGLNIVFFPASPLTSFPDRSIFGLTMPLRNGDYENYWGGALQTYSMSYFRVNPNGTCSLNPQDICEANLRKDPGFNLVDEGIDLIGGKQTQEYHVVVTKSGGNITVMVDGAVEANWIDDGKHFGPRLNGDGYLGLRQMHHGVSAVYTYFEVWNP
eukprot:m.151578 g.151578  ORF g.151578 m.151578 type:complete len:266 (-) comp30769_c1_seq3:76-873(-)